MTTLADLVPFVASRVPMDVPVANIQHALRESLVDFLSRSRVATSGFYIEQPCNRSDLLLDGLGCRRVVRIEGVYEQPHCRGVLPMWDHSWIELPQHDDHAPGWWIDPDDHDMTTLFVPAMQKPRRLYVRIAWTLSRDNTCDVPTWVYERYGNAIADGATAALLLAPTADDKFDRRAGLAQAAQSFERAIAEAINTRAAQAHGPNLKAPTFYGG